MPDAPHQMFVIGLPGAGKSTFLAALWHVLESKEVPGTLTLKRLTGDSTYLNEIRGRWLGAEELERTKTADETNVSLLLSLTNGDEFELWIPDLAGESFEAQWTDRVAAKDYCNYVRSSGCGLLFIHPDIHTEDLIRDVNALVPKLPDSDATTDGTSDDAAPWNSRFAPTQVQLVDLVQFIVSLRAPEPVHLAIVISAWDRLDQSTSPAAWMRTRLPLLQQFLDAHPDEILTRCFGISAQGGDLETAGAQLRKVATPSNRIIVRDGDYTGHDLSRPLDWLLSRSQNGSPQS